MNDSTKPHRKLLKKKMPRHVGIIMDGNGRWALQRKKPRYKGHVEGLEAAKRVVTTAAQIGLQFLSVYAFSTENWKRTATEVNYLMFLVKKHLRNEYKFYKENKVRIIHSGDLAALPKSIAASIRGVTEDTAAFTGLTVNIALNYGGRDEIIRGINKILAPAPKGLRAARPVTITETSFRKLLDQPEIPDPDLIIRTGGEQRISNFLLWQSAYAEIYFSDKLWPDWTGDDLIQALVDYQKRNRRFGEAK